METEESLSSSGNTNSQPQEIIHIGPALGLLLQPRRLQILLNPLLSSMMGRLLTLTLRALTAPINFTWHESRSDNVNSPIDDEDEDDLKLFERVSPCLFLNPGESRTTATFGGETKTRFWIFAVVGEDDLVFKENFFLGSKTPERVSRLRLRSDADLRDDRIS
ncbi:hypothetical protein F2Q68_00005978 [Brassica cretica]|uniref:Uncharacterized protein n=1 Tax=Brassica cretica TaxID=69181 RepID=A0A8S9J877_BRACR|nr:hypothetical protein F2Q68_00005978 [Brassica cretica]